MLLQPQQLQQAVLQADQVILQEQLQVLVLQEQQLQVLQVQAVADRLGVDTNVI